MRLFSPAGGIGGWHSHSNTGGWPCYSNTRTVRVPWVPCPTRSVGMSLVRRSASRYQSIHAHASAGHGTRWTHILRVGGLRLPDRFAVIALAILEKLEIGRLSRSRAVLAANADERAGEVRQGGRPRFIGHNARVENLR